MTVIVKNPINIKDGDCFVYRFTICKDEEPLCDIEYESTLDIFSDSLDPALPVVLFPAMRAGRDILFKGSISENLLAGTETIQNIFHMWYKKYSVVRRIRGHCPWGGSAEKGRCLFFYRRAGFLLYSGKKL